MALTPEQNAFFDAIGEGLDLSGGEITSGKAGAQDTMFPHGKYTNAGTLSPHYTSTAVDIQIPDGDEAAHRKLERFFRAYGYAAHAESPTDPMSRAKGWHVHVQMTPSGEAVAVPESPAPLAQAAKAQPAKTQAYDFSKVDLSGIDDQMAESFLRGQDRPTRNPIATLQLREPVTTGEAPAQAQRPLTPAEVEHAKRTEQEWAKLTPRQQRRRTARAEARLLNRPPTVPERVGGIAAKTTGEIIGIIPASAKALLEVGGIVSGLAGQKDLADRFQRAAEAGGELAAKAANPPLAEELLANENSPVWGAIESAVPELGREYAKYIAATKVGDIAEAGLTALGRYGSEAMPIVARIGREIEQRLGPTKAKMLAGLVMRAMPENASFNITSGDASPVSLALGMVGFGLLSAAHVHIQNLPDFVSPSATEEATRLRAEARRGATIDERAQPAGPLAQQWEERPVAESEAAPPETTAPPPPAPAPNVEPEAAPTAPAPEPAPRALPARTVQRRAMEMGADPVLVQVAAQTYATNRALGHSPGVAMQYVIRALEALPETAGMAPDDLLIARRLGRQLVEEFWPEGEMPRNPVVQDISGRVGPISGTPRFTGRGGRGGVELQEGYVAPTRRGAPPEAAPQPPAEAPPAETPAPASTLTAAQRRRRAAIAPTPAAPEEAAPTEAAAPAPTQLELPLTPMQRVRQGQRRGGAGQQVPAPERATTLPQEPVAGTTPAEAGGARPTRANEPVSGEAAGAAETLQPGEQTPAAQGEAVDRLSRNRIFGGRETADELAARIRQNLADLRQPHEGASHLAMFTAEMVRDLTHYGLIHAEAIAREGGIHAVTFARWSKEMVAELTPRVRPFLKELWPRVRAAWVEATEGLADTPRLRLKPGIAAPWNVQQAMTNNRSIWVDPQGRMVWGPYGSHLTQLEDKFTGWRSEDERMNADYDHALGQGYFRISNGYGNIGIDVDVSALPKQRDRILQMADLATPDRPVIVELYSLGHRVGKPIQVELPGELDHDPQFMQAAGYGEHNVIADATARGHKAAAIQEGLPASPPRRRPQAARGDEFLEQSVPSRGRSSRDTTAPAKRGTALEWATDDGQPFDIGKLFGKDASALVTADGQMVWEPGTYKHRDLMYEHAFPDAVERMNREGHYGEGLMRVVTTRQGGVMADVQPEWIREHAPRLREVFSMASDRTPVYFSVFGRDNKVIGDYKFVSPSEGEQILNAFLRGEKAPRLRPRPRPVAARGGEYLETTAGDVVRTDNPVSVARQRAVGGKPAKALSDAEIDDLAGGLISPEGYVIPYTEKGWDHHALAEQLGTYLENLTDKGWIRFHNMELQPGWRHETNLQGEPDALAAQRGFALRLMDRLPEGGEVNVELWSDDAGDWLHYNWDPRTSRLSPDQFLTQSINRARRGEGAGPMAARSPEYLETTAKAPGTSQPRESAPGGKSGSQNEPGGFFASWEPAEKGKDTLRGYRGTGNALLATAAQGSPHGSTAGTEGVGLYVAKSPDTAEFFGSPQEVEFTPPKHPLLVDEEPLPILNEEDVLFEPPSPKDSEWIAINKEAVQRSGTTNENWGRNQRKLQEALTDILRERGYDGVNVRSGGEEWTVLLDPKAQVKNAGDFPTWEDYRAQAKLVSKETADKALERIHSKIHRANMLIDPTVLGDAALYGAHVLETMARRMSDQVMGRITALRDEWSQHMVEDLGRDIEPHLDDLWDRARVRYEGEKYLANLNMERIETPDDVRDFLAEATDAMSAEIHDRRRGTRTWGQTAAAAQDLVDRWDLPDIKAVKRGQALNAEQLHALRTIEVALSERVKDASRAYQETPTPENLLRVMGATKEFETVHLTARGAVAEAGRALNQQKMIAKAVEWQNRGTKQRALERALDLLGGREMTEEMQRAFAALPDDDPVAAVKFLRSVQQHKTFDKIFYYWISSILSNPATHAVNLYSNTIFQALQTPERALRGLLDIGISKLQRRQQEYFIEETMPALVATYGGLEEGLRKGLFAFIHGLSPDEAAKFEVSPFYEMKGGAKNPINWPTRLLGAADGVAKAMNFEGELHALATRQGMKEGLRGRALADRIAELVQDPPDEMLEGASEHSHYATFTDKANDLEKAFAKLRRLEPKWLPDEWGAKPLQFVMPFLHTPARIANAGFEYSPLGFFRLLNSDVRRGSTASEASAKALLGSAVLAFAALKAAHGELTGGVPNTPAKRDEFYRSGRQPYSIKVGNHWVSYVEAGPFAIPFSTAAAMWDSFLAKGEMPAAQRIEQAGSMVAKGITDRSYLQGISNMIDLLQDPHRQETFLSQTAAGFVWPSGFLRGVAQTMDPIVREPHGIPERIEAGLPVLSERVRARRDALGRPSLRGREGLNVFNPTRPSRATTDPVDRELARLDVQPGLAPQRLRIGAEMVKLTPDQRSSLQQAIGSATYKAVKQIISDPQYERATDEQRAAWLDRAVDRVRDASREAWRRQEMTRRRTAASSR